MSYDVSVTTTNTPPTALLSHTEWIRGLARSLVRDAAAADDLTQDTLLAALRGQPRDPARLRPWLAGIARNLAKKERRKRRLQSDHEAERALDALREEDPAHLRTASQAATLARAEAHRSLVEHVLAMPEPSRTLLLQRYFEGRKPAEIASLQGITPAAVHAGLTRAHGALREKLEGQGGKQEWLATVGLLLLPMPGRDLAAAAATSTAGSAAAAAVASPIRGASWKVASTVGAFALVAAAATITFHSNEEGMGVQLKGERDAGFSTAFDPDALAPPSMAVEGRDSDGSYGQAISSADTVHESEPTLGQDGGSLLGVAPGMTSTSCQAARPNSTGFVGSLSTASSDVPASQGVTLVVDQLPSATTVLLLASPTPFFDPSPGVNQGSQCIGGKAERYLGPGQIRQTNLNGRTSLRIDLGGVPQPMSLMHAVQGQTWRFQAWHWDGDPEMTSNFTNGLNVMLF